MLSDSRWVPIICILFLDFARFVTDHSVVKGATRLCFKMVIVVIYFRRQSRVFTDGGP